MVVLCRGQLSFSPVISVYTDGNRSPWHTSLKYLGLRCPPRVRLEELAWPSSQTLYRQCVDRIRYPFLCLTIVCVCLCVCVHTPPGNAGAGSSVKEYSPAL